MTDIPPELLIELSPDQQEAIDRINNWWLTEPDKQCFTLAGYAGTGKTTVIYHILREFSERVVVGAPTGKAAYRLRQKGVDASTIHQLAYRYTGVNLEGEPTFDFEGMRDRPPLVIIDEASMVNDEIYQDLLREGYRMLFVGDHGQLAPVGRDPGIMLNPDFALSEIHRTDDQGLLSFAHALRCGERRPEASGAVETVFLDPRQEFNIIVEATRDAEVVLCWKNTTRWWLNHVQLVERGLLPREPLDFNRVNDYLRQLRGQRVRVACLRNNHKKGAYNGQVMDFVVGTLRNETLFGQLITDNGREVDAQLDARGFFLREKSYTPQHDHLLFDFGYALTANKSQGSEWPSVVVIDELTSRKEDAPRWRYTGATRAEKGLTWLHR